MKNFRGRITQTNGNSYLIEDSDSETDSEVEAVYTAGNFEIFIDGFGLDGDLIEEEDSSDTSGSEEDVDLEPILNFGGGGGATGTDDELEESENISLEGYFAFGGRLRSRRGRSSQDSFEISFPPRSPRSPPPLENLENPEGHAQGHQAEGEGEREDNVSEEGYQHTDTPIPMWEGSSTPTDRLEFSNSDSEGEGNEIIVANTPSPPPPLDSDRDREPESEPEDITSTRVTSPSVTPTSTSASAQNQNSISCSIQAPTSKMGSVEPQPSIPSESGSGEGSAVEADASELEKSEIEVEKKEEGEGEGTNANAGAGCENALNEVEDGVSESGESENGRTATSATEEPEEETCNPMVSDAELDENDDTLRGDRIGATTYSERHVLKILIKWVQELPKYSEEGVKEEDATGVSSSTTNSSAPGSGSGIDKTRFLEPDFEEEMSLLWDMSFEQDVMNFLVQQNIFNIIRDTIQLSHCARLTEVGLGIMANIISQQSILEDFSIHDASLKLVDGIISLVVKLPRVPVLIQVFAVLRRITWFLRHVALVSTWMDLLISSAFLNCVNFIMSSSTNVLLLGNVIVTLFSILETLSPETEREADAEASDLDDEDQDRKSGTGTETEESPKSSFFFGKALQSKRKDFLKFKKFQPFCDTGFIQSSCEGLNELMKNPKPRKVQKLTSTRDPDPDRENEPPTERSEIEDLELPIPDGLVQNAIINGLSSFYILYKTPNGKEAIRENHSIVLSFLLNLFEKFTLCTDSLDYYAIAVNLLSFCHRELGELSPQAVEIPVRTGSKLMEMQMEMEHEHEEHENQRERQTRFQNFQIKLINDDSKPQPHDSKTFIALVVHEYLAGLADSFGQEAVTLVKTKISENLGKGKHVGFFNLVDKLVGELSAKCVSEASEDENYHCE